ncbi:MULTISPECIES: crotonase/enoyl-CoA hydratase family protein [unclassified Colwellia]|uniref:crotonase/enoyl-CoA hydratase family protein n=1 Tax=unclassified Colwellia TaxID=196834 RepID=UPI0015F3CADA|nr:MULTISPECIES: crotonase/enoyl-CoA hydratase family protein [unclassified Colwellia]MBA6355499.1 crotonase/enoyl-CoA hydratase family protein [Colwellia sp. BRX8-3]MBA6358508.1 crotonase/enoyl-CoA hydratase family protein [Colwellia sp. BRX8-6]MBA6366842.1 crotonase/enoyl-CoA hydratase family protein [Colwellia sp. BRX8-5]MBA6373605.1 crotonase/enoyl-CoA hydratase family protein [Colwellia sp. BRX8-2]
MPEKTVLLTIENNIAYVALNRADKHNAINMMMFYQLDNIIKQLQKDKSLRAVIVHGKGVDFCSGLDVKSVMKAPVNIFKLLFKWLPGQSNLAQRVSTGWRKIPAPVIMALHGRVWGGGLQIALGGDFRFVEPSATLSILEARWGLIPDMGGTLALKEHLPADQAKLLAMTGQEISAQQALEFKLITDICADPLVSAKSLADKLCQQSPDAVAGVKKLYNHVWWRSDRFTLARETYYQLKVMLGKNQKIKTYNQTHSTSEAKVFKDRGDWS